MSLEIGSKVKGKVTGITKFGAFVELPGGVSGLVHISEVASEYVTDIKDHLKIGDEVEVKVLDIKEDKKISLSIKRTIENSTEGNEKTKIGYVKRERKSDYGAKKDRNSGNNYKKKESFEDKLKDFLKVSEENLSSIKRNTESKRGGRGGRRG